MLQRKIEKNIRKWIKESKKALLIDGARQVGKTFVIRKVLKDEGCHYIEFNLLNTPEIVRLLENSESVDDMITNLSLFTRQSFIKGETFIFFDEIQEFKELTTKIKFWVDEGSFRYIFSGSLLGVELRNIKSSPVGYLRTFTMYPLDFEEFLQIYNFTEDLKDSLYKSFINKIPVNEEVHKRMLNIFKIYLIVGGMPAAVDKFQETRNLFDVIEEHEDIILQYKKDFTRYETDDKKLLLTRIYDLIPAELNASNKRFNFSDIKKGLRYERSENGFIWLESAGVALPTYNVSAPTLPLLLNEKSSLFKLFLSDVGLLTSLYGKATKVQLLSNNIDINNGAIFENAVAQELKSHGFNLYYYNSKKFGELDFVIEYNGKVLPIEVKSGKSYQRHSALKNIMEISNYCIQEAFVFSNYNVEVKDNLVYYPVYMIMFIQEKYDSLPIIELDDLSNL
ncbi:ATP-binding protein [Floccifex sp.]|uniref:ATP-binding protein n=1 Tax=Floccifex sp. TaxID=2815810 RepID=UPI003F03EB0D